MKNKNDKNKLKIMIKQAILLLSGLGLIFAFQNCSEYSVEQEGNAFSNEDQSFNSFAKTSCSASNAVAFPGAEGFGKNTKGGRGGRVVHVTNLNNSGNGSLRWALEDVKEPRIVVFDVEGKIKLKTEISIRSPYVTIAGQTAPGDGIVVSGGRVHVRTKEVIVRGLKSRPGDESGGDIGKNRDSLSIGGNGIKGVENIIVDHNSFSWAVDETLTVWGTTKNITLSNNILAEALHDSIHVHETSTDGSTAPHSKGLLIGQKKGEALSQNITVARNLFTSNHARNPFFKSGYKIDFINNYLTNYGMAHQAMKVGGSGPVTANIINNYWEEGKDTPNDTRKPLNISSAESGSKLYFSKNFVEGHGDVNDPISDKARGSLKYNVNSKVFNTTTSVISTDKVKSAVLANAGARSPSGELDPVDERIIREVRSGNNRLIDSQREVGGYGVYNFRGRTVKDSDKDGMPDSFEIANKSKGLDPNRADDKKDHDGDGYTNIEEYINGLIDGFDLAGCSGDSGGSTGGPSLPPEDPDPVDPDPVDPNPVDNGEYQVVEAENMYLDGFETKSNSSASSGKWIQANGDAKASFDFPLEDGNYNIIIKYYDENDGQSKMNLVIDGKTVDSFTWSKNLGSNLANSQTLTSRRIENVSISARDLVELVGTSNGGEPLRTDYIGFEKIEEAPRVPASSEAVTVEAEDMDLSGFDIKSNSAASDGKWVQSNASASASLDFNLDSGTYDVTIGYFDENDGKSKMSLIVAGKTIETFTWNKNLGSSLANKNTATSYTIKGVKINARDIVKLSGVAEGKEPLRTDYIKFQKVEDVVEESEPFEDFRVEAEDMKITSGLKIVSSTSASGGKYVQTGDSSTGTISLVFEGPDGDYNLKLGYFDENDGASKMSLIVADKELSTWDWNKNLGSPLANKTTLTSKTFNSISLKTGDVIKFKGRNASKEPMRTDYLEISQ